MLVSIDLETYLIGRCQLAPPIVCAGWVPDLPGSLREVNLWADALPIVVGFYEESHIIGANLAFDSACIMASEPDLIPIVFQAYRDGRIRDVLLQEKMIDIAMGQEHESYSLASCSERRLKHPMNKKNPWRLEYASLARVPIDSWPKGAIEYILDDIDVPVQLDNSQRADSERWAKRMGSGLLEQSGSEAYAGLVFFLASAWGVRTSPGRVGTLELAVKKRLDKARGRLVSVGLVRANGTRDTKAATALMARKGGSKLTAGGKLSLDKDACTLSWSRVLELYSEYSTASTTMSRIQKLAQGAELPLHASFDTLLNTYRTSSYESKLVPGIQLQNFGKSDGTRETLEPRPGHVFLVSDVSSMEAHYWAQFCIDMGWGSRLAEMLNAGVDIHCTLGSLVFERPASEVKGKDRDDMKAGNYGFLGGMGVDKFILTQRKASGRLFERAFVAKLKEAWLTMTAPSSHKFFAHISQLTRCGPGTLRHPSTGVWRTANYCSLANFTFQHPSAIGVKRALCQAQYECYSDRSSALFGSRMINAIHDEGVFECLESRASEAAERLGGVMAWGVNTLLPDVPTKAPPLICRTWSKKHKPKRDEQGRLVIS